MIFSTKIPLKQQKYNQINYNSKLLLLGSCFSENIGNKFSYYKFQSQQNPFGILFHPKAIENFITNSINNKRYTEKDVFFLNERWHSFETHSNLSSQNQENLLHSINKAINYTSEQIPKLSHLIITLGTSWVYREIETDKIVANCHKVPQKKFLKEILTVDQITSSLEAIQSLIKSVNKDITIIYTVSPVRHIKDGFIENQQSKSHLISAIHNVVEARKNIHYFPSYEIVMDELRDYRFYAEDMIHPNSTAIDYIWERFSNTWISEQTRQTMNDVDTIQKGLNHRPFNPNSEAHQKFLNKLSQKKETLIKVFPFMNF